jgi:hypothetical protein
VCAPPFAACLDAALGRYIPGGACSRLCSPPSGPEACGPDGECWRAPGGFSLCIPNCGSSQDCRPGFQCVSQYLGIPTARPVCVAGTADPQPLGHDCASDLDCTAGSQVCGLPEGEPPQPVPPAGGYCSSLCNPSAPGSCGDGAVCSPFSNCLPSCTTDTDCQGIRTPGSLGQLVCADRYLGQPLPVPACIRANPEAHVGDPCMTAGDCPVGGLCQAFYPRSPDPFVNGYCVVVCNPNDADSCGADAVCLANDPSNPNAGQCFKSCTTDGDCRLSEGYLCSPLDPTRPELGGFCGPKLPGR